MPLRKTIAETLAGSPAGEPHSASHLAKYGDTALPAGNTSGSGAVGRKKGVPNKITVEGRNFARTFTDSERWTKMIWFWIDNPEMMPAGVFNTLMAYRYGKPVQTVKVKGEIMARPFLGDSKEQLALRAREIAARIEKLNAITVESKVVGEGTDDSE